MIFKTAKENINLSTPMSEPGQCPSASAVRLKTALSYTHIFSTTQLANLLPSREQGKSLGSCSYRVRVPSSTEPKQIGAVKPQEQLPINGGGCIAIDSQAQPESDSRPLSYCHPQYTEDDISQILHTNSSLKLETGKVINKYPYAHGHLLCDVFLSLTATCRMYNSNYLTPGVHDYTKKV